MIAFFYEDTGGLSKKEPESPNAGTEGHFAAVVANHYSHQLVPVRVQTPQREAQCLLLCHHKWDLSGLQTQEQAVRLQNETVKV